MINIFNIGNLKVYGVIYGIKNKLNGKWYIGQTKTYNGFKSRYNRSGDGIERVYKYHKDFKGTPHCNEHLLCSIEKYGFDAFEINEVMDYAFSKKELNVKEKCWISIKDSFRNGYNRNEGGDSQLYTCKYSDEQIKLAKELLADINNSLEYISKLTELPLTYIYEVMKLRVRDEVCSELNHQIKEIRSMDYVKAFMNKNEELISKLYHEGKTKEEILNYFPNAINRIKIVNAINRLLKLLPYRDRNRTKICPICGKEFAIKDRSSNRKKYCCKACAKEADREKSKQRYYKNKLKS